MKAIQSYIKAKAKYEAKLKKIQEMDTKHDEIHPLIAEGEVDFDTMIAHFKKRTMEHIGRVVKYIRAIEKAHPGRFKGLL